MIPYVEITIQLHSCLKDDDSPINLAKAIKGILVETLKPEYKSDIDVEISEAAGWEPPSALPITVT